LDLEARRERNLKKLRARDPNRAIEDWELDGPDIPDEVEKVKVK